MSSAWRPYQKESNRDERKKKRRPRRVHVIQPIRRVHPHVPAGAILVPKVEQVWIHQWSHIPKFQDNNLFYSMKEILKYYPKNIRAIKAFELSITKELTDRRSIERIRKLYLRIMSKY